MRYYLGLATTFHDPALALIGPDGTVLFAEGAERFLQYKRAPNCEPDPATRMVGLLAELVPEGSELVVASTWGQQFTEFLEGQGRTGAFTLEALGRHAPVLNRSFVPERAERIFVAEMAIAQARAGYGTLLALDQETRGRGGAARARIVRQDRFPHHLTHAAYALWGSPFSDATAVIVDGMGETGAAALYRMEAGRIAEVRRHRGRGSVGFLYGLVTDLAGFDQLKGEEWKIMGLAPYGRSDPALVAQLRRLYTAEGGRLKFTDDATVRDVVATILSRRPADLGEAGWADLARSGQEVFSELMDILVAEAWALSPHENLVIAGGCGLNSSYNGRVLERSSFSRLHVPSAPGDDGNAVGAAWLAYAADNPGWTGPAPEARPLTPYLGSRVSTAPMERLAEWEPRARKVGHAAATREAARILAAGGLVGWVQGRAEFGPRSLGNRSILADPRPAGAKDALNAKVKYREAFRPFAPSILAEAGPDWFEAYADSPYMERTLVWRESKRDQVPAVVHADGTGRLQSVTPARNPAYAALIAAFAEITGVPILLNTSFNVMGKPILHTAEDAILMFTTTGLDALVVEDWIVVK
ncbi:carbamoyltransferase [Methylobacterium sp. E-041]|jgi:carbamoyltransferase|nr:MULTISPECIES: carbamoyltransferase C-terminal domain-containing protein [unclassified Methylobacterium]MCJ2010881.1 carbamoyltransferase [Methylobacterium sp. J-092]MCJ2042660.1 carbamoyltransferase [Methylobacterium sp. J-059]MCJ2104939.1 carbamoyltransferase [Methylobacterium sp. E-041]MCJ2114836.1 carbamoyltransferase [Methylobacterium sp. E-025]TXN44723.1 carbamoyltransferase [Methylobacterium sp. WL119]